MDTHRSRRRTARWSRALRDAATRNAAARATNVARRNLMIVGLLLAAGGARRFGSQKLVASLDGTPLVRHAADALSQVTHEMVVVVGSDAPTVTRALEGIAALIVENSEWEQGLS